MSNHLSQLRKETERMRIKSIIRERFTKRKEKQKQDKYNSIHKLDPNSIHFLYEMGKEIYDNNTETGNYKEYEKAQEFFLKVLEKGKGNECDDDDDARRWMGLAGCHLGWCYHFGYGTVVDIKKAMKYYEDAATLNCGPALNAIGLLYYAGTGVDDDPIKATEYYRKGAILGYRSSEYNMGLNLYHGSGARIDRAEAKKWFLKSAEKGDNDAMEWYATCCWVELQKLIDITTDSEGEEGGEKEKHLGIDITTEGIGQDDKIILLLKEIWKWSIRAQNGLSEMYEATPRLSILNSAFSNLELVKGKMSIETRRNVVQNMVDYGIQVALEEDSYPALHWCLLHGGRPQHTLLNHILFPFSFRQTTKVLLMIHKRLHKKAFKTNKNHLPEEEECYDDSKSPTILCLAHIPPELLLIIINFLGEDMWEDLSDEDCIG